MIEIRDYLGQPEDDSRWIAYPKNTIISVGIILDDNHLRDGQSIFPRLAKDFGYKSNPIRGYTNGEIYCHLTVPGKYLLWDQGTLFINLSSEERDQIMCPVEVAS